MLGSCNHRPYNELVIACLVDIPNYSIYSDILSEKTTYKHYTGPCKSWDGYSEYKEESHLKSFVQFVLFALWSNVCLFAILTECVYRHSYMYTYVCVCVTFFLLLRIFF